MKRRIILGLTGSVASVLYVKLIEQLGELGEVDVVLTRSSYSFIDFSKLCESLEKVGGTVYSDESEWSWKNNDGTLRSKWEKDDKVLHIELRNKASALVIAPCSANTLAKVANGLCDNLLTTIARAWDMNRPFAIAPAMNTHMWEHPVTKDHLKKFINFSVNNHIYLPQSKMLACGTEGVGAMTEIEGIVKMTEDFLRWKFPLHPTECSGIPIGNHPGAFLCKRKHHTHTGVDLYTKDGASVFSVEAGKIVGREAFTGPKENSPWWNETDCLLVEGATGVVCYGEIMPSKYLNIGDTVERGTYLGEVKQVLKDGKERPDIMGHSKSMLHMELYPHGKYRAFREVGYCDTDLDDFSVLRDPTPFLMESYDKPEKTLTV
jgi:phosphopantothenoylcysteine decarboxylase